MFCSLALHSQSWIKMDNFPSVERDDAVSFVIGDIAFCGTGLIVGWAETTDFYSFNMNSEKWTTIASMPNGNKRQYASGFATANHGFVFGGINAGVFLNDIWQYDPTIDGWIEKSTLPALGRSGAASFTIKDTAYIIGGRTALSGAINEIWAYDMVNDTWWQKKDFPFNSSWWASGTTYKDHGYLIFGRNENNVFTNHLYEYDSKTDTWTERSDFPGIGRSHSNLSSISNQLIVMGGIDSSDHYYNDIWSFNLASKSWNQLDSLPSIGRKGAVNFNNGRDIYYSTGIDQNSTRLNETWKYVNPTKREVGEENQIFIYPNPTNSSFEIELITFTSGQFYDVMIFDNFGKTIITKKVAERTTGFNMTNFSKGIYFVLVQTNTGLKTMKLIVQ